MSYSEREPSVSFGMRIFPNREPHAGDEAAPLELKRRKEAQEFYKAARPAPPVTRQYRLPTPQSPSRHSSIAAAHLQGGGG